jgi:hypothetical protein
MNKKQRKPYKKPDIKSEKVLETLALACGKCIAGGPISQGACIQRSRLS